MVGAKMRKRLMIVDDNPDLLYTVERIFQEDDIDVITVNCGDECLKEVEKGFHGLILLDIMMEDKSGWEVIRELDENGMAKDTVIAMLTAKNSPDERRSELQRYVVDYIRKPFTRDELKVRIDECFRYLEA